jgi:hypothetical protein
MAARYEARLMEQMLQTMGFLLITWLPLQIAAIWIVKHPLARIGAALAIIPIIPILVTGFQTKTYRDGSLFGILFMGIYVPVMIYLALFFFAGLAARSAKKTAPESTQTGTEPNAGKQIPVVLLTLAVLFGLGVLVCFFVLDPR